MRFLRFQATRGARPGSDDPCLTRRDLVVQSLQEQTGFTARLTLIESVLHVGDSGRPWNGASWEYYFWLGDDRVIEWTVSSDGTVGMLRFRDRCRTTIEYGDLGMTARIMDELPCQVRFPIAAPPVCETPSW
jgi:hypothetical protein